MVRPHGQWWFKGHSDGKSVSTLDCHQMLAASIECLPLDVKSLHGKSVVSDGGLWAVAP